MNTLALMSTLPGNAAPPGLAGTDGVTAHGGSDSRPPVRNLAPTRPVDKESWLAARVARRMIAKYSAAWALRIAQARRDRYARAFVCTLSEASAARRIYWDVVVKRCAAVAGLNDGIRVVA